MAQHFRLLTEQQVQSLLPMGDLIAAMESALARFSAGEVLQPVRTVLTVGPSRAYFGLMPAYVPTPGSLGAKLVTATSELGEVTIRLMCSSVLNGSGAVLYRWWLIACVSKTMSSV